MLDVSAHFVSYLGLNNRGQSFCIESLAIAHLQLGVERGATYIGSMAIPQPKEGGASRWGGGGMKD